MTIGQRLRAAREAKHISIGDIARRTFIQAKFLQAIDDDNLGILPETHRRLFVREYARSVGVNAEELYPLLDDFVPPPPPRTEIPAYSSGKTPSSEKTTWSEKIPWSDKIPWGGKRDGSSEGSSTLGSSSTMGQSPTYAPTPINEPLPESERRVNREILKRLSSGSGVKLGGGGAAGWMIRGALLLLVVIGGYFLIRGLGGSKDADISTGLDTASDDQAQVLPRAGDSAAADVDSNAVVTGDSLTLEGRATGRVWVAIVSDGKKSQQGAIDSGEVKTWRAAETFRLSVSNAGGLQLSLNGKSLGTLGPLKTSVRNQVIDINGVKGRQTNTPRRSSTTPTPAAAPATAARRPATTTATTPSTTTRRRATTTANRPSTTSRRRPAIITPTQPRGTPLPPSSP